jgi:stalled ribosome rescue protein Dom34
MRVLELDLGRRFAKVKVDDKLDLWHLQNIIEAGDLVTARTLRSIFVQRGDKKEKVEKRHVVLTVKAEKIELHEHADKLRVNGRIVEAPKEIQLGDYHTIEVGISNILTIEKNEWKPEHVERLERAKIKMGVVNADLMNEFFMHINKGDGLAVYGFKQVKFAAESNAVKVVLVPEDRIREKGIEELIREVESKGGKIKLVSAKMEFGQKFCRTYDVGAILRFPIS